MSFDCIVFGSISEVFTPPEVTTGLFDRAKVSYCNSEMLEQINELRALFAGDGIDLCVHRYARERDYDGHELFGKQEVERIYEIAVVVLAEIAQDARIELLLRKRGLEVDNNFISPPFHLTHMRARGEYHRARHAEMGEQHLAEIGIDVLPGFRILNSYRNISQRQPLKPRAESLVRFERNERRLYRGHGVPRLFCEFISVAC